MRSLCVAAVAALCFAAPAFAGDLSVTNAWIRALPAGLPSGGYFTLKNAGATPRTLTGAASPACGMLMLHKSGRMGGMMHMSAMERLDVPAHGTLVFAPGGNHLMCTEPKAAIKPGGSVTVTLQFAGGETLTAEFKVKSAKGN